MDACLLRPGVYVEEVPPLARPIAGVGTSTPLFIGVMDGILAANFGKPQVSSPTGEFETKLGPRPRAPCQRPAGENPRGHQEASLQAANRTLALAVFGFFNNGGTACYVVPVTARGTWPISPQRSRRSSRSMKSPLSRLPASPTPRARTSRSPTACAWRPHRGARRRREPRRPTRAAIYGADIALSASQKHLRRDLLPVAEGEQSAVQRRVCGRR